MFGETVTETLFGNIWKNSRKNIYREPERRRVLGILAFEVSRLMSEVVNLWRSLNDRQIARLREELANSVGIQKLVSEDENNLMRLALAEVIQNFESLVRSVTVLGKKCTDPTYHNLENVFDNLSEIDSKWYGWRYRLKKMERKVKKMDKFVGSTEQLYHQIEVLAELEQSLKRMKAGANTGRMKLLEFHQMVVCQRQEVKILRETSPWVRSYDYIVRLLLRSLFTIFERIKYVNETDQIKRNDDYREIEIHNDCSGEFLHNKSISKNQKCNQLKSRRFATLGFTGCTTIRESPFIKSCTRARGNSFRSNVRCDDVKVTSPIRASKNESFFKSMRVSLDARPSTLGYTSLALHYANIIILIEKLASSPHLISLDARDDLYNMLPAIIRSCLRAKLKMFSRNSASSVYDPALAAEWGLAVTRILEWLSPLAHNMVQWQSQRKFERQRSVYESRVLLVQTLHFANKERIEAAIVELLMGINYLHRYGQEVNERTFQEPSRRENVLYNRIGHMT